MGPKNADEFIGREYELERLNDFLADPKARIAVVYGRRRVGKTRLIIEALKNHKFYRFEGLEGQTTARQKAHFSRDLAEQLRKASLAHLKEATWQEILSAVANESLESKVIFLDEFQWIAASRSELVSALKYVWDNQFSKIPGFKLIICGSISSFLVRKVLRSKALYGRVSLEINLRQLPLGKLGEFFPEVKSSHQLLDFYLAVGGIPEYWKLYDPSRSTGSNLSKLAFHQTAYFVSEFDRIFTSHFGKKKIYLEIISFLSSRFGVSRLELINKSNSPAGGNFSSALEDLELAGFISAQGPYDKSTNSSIKKYYLTDFYLRFYFAFINPNRARILKLDKPIHINAMASEGAYSFWRGMAFELLCQKEADIIAQILGFSAVKYTYGPYLKRDEKKSGLQIDLLFLRADKVIVLCEAKYQQSPLALDIVEEIERKVIRAKFSEKYAVERVLISAGPVSRELQNYGYFSKIIPLDTLMQSSV